MNRDDMKAYLLTMLTLLGSATGLPAQQAAEAPAGSAGLVMPNQEKARSVVESVYNTWRLGVLRGDESAWRRSTSSSRQVKVRNMIISERGQFPKDFFRGAQNAPQLENFRYVGALGGCGGKTMAATYIGKMKLGNAQPKENAFVLLLVSEPGGWKLDQTRFFDLSHLPQVLKRLKARDLTVLREQDGFHPYSAVPPTPPTCGAPELIGKVFVDCPGRVVEMRINGISLHEFEDERRADTISGGLRRGTNTITYTIRDSSRSQNRPSLGIGLVVMPETQGNHPVWVFDHILDAKDTAHGGSFTFNVTPEHIASMNPKHQGPPAPPFHAVPLKTKENASPKHP